MGLAWSILFFFLTTDTPADSKIISEKERVYIIEETREIVAAHAEGESVW
jgi:hypothetical protein